MMNSENPILKVEDLRVHFKTDDGLTVRAVDGVSFDLYKGKTLGIVGESGSGKSVTSLSIMGLLSIPPGKIEGGRALFHDKDLLSMSEKELRRIRGNRISMIFQDPMTALNPFLTVSEQITEVLRTHKKMNKKTARTRAVELLSILGVADPDKRIDNYPHQFSGGMRQRVMIAIALACDPEILIADEPTSALDVTIQAQIVELMEGLSRKFGTAIIMITHDLGIVAGMCDEIVVMYAGHSVEKGDTRQIFANPLHPYTEGLIQSVPRLDGESKKLYSIPGQPPDITNSMSGCPFAPRCYRRMERCNTEKPRLFEKEPGHWVSCHLYN